MKKKTDSQIIDDLGGTGFLASVFRITPASVSEWRKNGIPEYRKQMLALMYPDKVPSAWAPESPQTA